MDPVSALREIAYYKELAREESGPPVEHAHAALGARGEELLGDRMGSQDEVGAADAHPGIAGL